MTEHVFVKIKDNALKSIPISNILFVKVSGDYCTIKTKDLQYTTHSTMINIESILSKELFVRIHNSTLVKLSEIAEIHADSVIISSRETLTVSRSRMKELKEKIVII